MLTYRNTHIYRHTDTGACRFAFKLWLDAFKNTLYSHLNRFSSKSVLKHACVNVESTCVQTPGTKLSGVVAKVLFMQSKSGHNHVRNVFFLLTHVLLRKSNFMIIDD